MIITNQILFIFSISIFQLLVLSHSSTNCEQSCVNVITGHSQHVPYPFGFSSGCHIRLNCSNTTGNILFGEFPVRTISSNGIIIHLEANCDRPIHIFHSLFGKYYAPTSKNGFLLQNCSSPGTRCLFLSTTLVQTHFESLQCNNNSMTATTNNNSTISCYSENKPNGFLSYEKVKESKCQYLMSSILARSSNDSGISLEVQVVQLGWWLEGDCQCSDGASCIPMISPTTRNKSYQCQCKKGHVGDGYRNGIGCGKGSSSGLNIRLKFAIGVSSAAVASSIIIILVLCFHRREGILYKLMIFRIKKTKNDQDVDAFIRNNGSHHALKQYRYSDVKKMTKSFKDKLGQGGYGCVYKGKLSDGCLVAVKVLNESKGNGEEFLNEVASISRTSHVNVVTLLGFCYERTKRALIYEFMPNGSLDQFIYIEKSSNTHSQLEWKILYQIAVGIARGLEYLHIGCNMRILHFDIKPHNILLDEEFYPKISDFGLAKLCQRKESIISMQGVRGTVGYIAPEVFNRHFGGVSYKSDVYSYGMMVLEIVGGRRNIEVGVSHISEIYFPHWIFKYLEPASAELRLNRVITKEEDEELARKMILVGLWCIQTKPSDRPSMTKVVEMLEGSIQSIQIPPKPFLSSPPRSLPQHSSTVSVSEPSSNLS